MLTVAQQIILIEKSIPLLKECVDKGFGLCVTLELAAEQLGGDYWIWNRSTYTPLSDIGLKHPEGINDETNHWFEVYDYGSRCNLLLKRLQELKSQLQ